MYGGREREREREGEKGGGGKQTNKQSINPNSFKNSIQYPLPVCPTQTFLTHTQTQRERAGWHEKTNRKE